MKNRKNLRYLTQLSVLLALELILAYTPLGYLRVLPGLEISFLMIPRCPGRYAAWPCRRGCFGRRLWPDQLRHLFGASTFGATLLAVDPLFTFLTCVPTRLWRGGLTKGFYSVCCRAALPARSKRMVSRLLFPAMPLALRRWPGRC